MVPRRRGRIVNMSSVSGLVGSAGRSAYGAAKGEIATLTKVLAVDGGSLLLAFNGNTIISVRE